MTSNTLYYGEIVAQISGHLFSNPQSIEVLEKLIEEDKSHDHSIWTICADAARVFDTLEDLVDEHFLNWPAAVTHYADAILNLLLVGEKPSILDMMYLANRSIYKLSNAA